MYTRAFTKVTQRQSRARFQEIRNSNNHKTGKKLSKLLAKLTKQGKPKSNSVKKVEFSQNVLKVPNFQKSSFKVISGVFFQLLLQRFFSCEKS